MQESEHQSVECPRPDPASLCRRSPADGLGRNLGRVPLRLWQALVQRGCIVGVARHALDPPTLTCDGYDGGGSLYFMSPSGTFSGLGYTGGCKGQCWVSQAPLQHVQTHTSLRHCVRVGALRSCWVASFCCDLWKRARSRD